MRRRFRFLSLLGIALLLTGSASANVATLSAVKDNTLYSNDPELSNGAGVYFFTGRTAGADLRRAVVAFDVAAAIPAGSTINSVSLQLYMSRTQAGGENVSLHRVLSDWGEGSSNASGQEGGGDSAENGDATWQYTFYNAADPPASPAWSNPGGDFSGTASATTSVGGEDFYTWGSSAALVADVQAWLDTPVSNYGWIVVGNESANMTAKRFNSRQNNGASERPALTVDFTPPAAGTGACCFDDGTCTELSPGDCSTQSGSYQGDGSDCTPNPCPQPGACCLPGGTCADLLESACNAQLGVFQGAGTTCVTTTCVGACCLAAGACVETTLGDCTTQTGTYQGYATSCTPNNCPVVLTPYLDPLPLPGVAQPVSGTSGGVATYDIPMQEFDQQLHSELPPTRVWGYAGSYPGPTIEAGRDLPVTVRWINDLRDEFDVLRTDHYLPVDLCPHGADLLPRTVVHLHGGHVPADVDGYPEDTFLPGQMAEYVYPNNQLPATLWYHDHALGVTRLNVYMGLAGVYLLRDAFELGLGLPDGAFEIPLAIQDRSFNADGTWKYPAAWQDHFFGDTILVNGKVWPYLAVSQGKYRFRLLNGSNSRVYTLALSTGDPFQQIGTDGGLLPAPVPVTEITLASGERADVVVDFAGYPPGTTIILTNSAPAPYPGTPGEGVIPEIMKFIVQDNPGHTAALPATLRPLDELLEQDAVQSRGFELQKVAEPCAGAVWLINGLAWDDITEYPVLDTIEIWRFINRSGVVHPMHMHLVMFQVLDRQDFVVVDGDIVPTGTPVPAADEEAGWKDTVKAQPNQITRVIARFENYTGLFPYHCHILEHEDHEMMRQFQAVECLVDADCNDGMFCTGAETCDPATFTCQPGTAPDCDDGVTCTVDTCNEMTDTCDHVPDDAACDDTLFCNGAETCDALLDCQPGAAPDCNDGIACTVDTCNEMTDTCDHVPDDAACDDTLFCNGAETCDPLLDCQPGVAPCPDQPCDEAGNVCVDCLVDDDCADGVHCNGVETCDPESGTCVAGTPVVCDDGIICTVDTCNEMTDTCDHVPDDAACDDTLFCNGLETCDPLLDCQPGAAPDCDDGIACTVDTCNEMTDTCDHAPDDAACDDTLFCNGLETCDPLLDCQPGAAPDCDDGIACTVDTCNEMTDTCDHVPDDAACDDTLFCNGLETCDPLLDCQSGMDPCPGEPCDEVGDACGGCISHGDCADMNADAVRDDNCIWWACEAGTCVDTAIVFADMGGQFGLCPPDGTADGNDRFHALNCFANIDPNGGAEDPYLCENTPPAAFNVDAGGPFGDCAPDGVCDGNDAFAALNAFEGGSTCSCPLDGSPAPTTPINHRIIKAELALVAPPAPIQPGAVIDIDVYLATALDDLRGYQLHVESSGGRSGALELVDIAIRDLGAKAGHESAPFAFDDLAYWDAYNVKTRQMVAGLDTAGIATDAGTYLATFTFRASKDARGTFSIELQHNETDAQARSFLFNTAAHERLMISAARPATVTMGSRNGQ